MEEFNTILAQLQKKAKTVKQKNLNSLRVFVANKEKRKKIGSFLNIFVHSLLSNPFD